MPRRDYVEVSGSIIPAPDRRWCGPEFKDDRFYLQSAEREAQRLVEHFQCTSSARVLDIGCGQGRLPIGLLRVLGDVNYTGLDIHRDSIEWCRRHIESHHPSCRFFHLDVYNERYNAEGVRLKEGFRFDLQDESADIIYLYSVFSHTTEQDMKTYLQEFSRILSGDGGIFFTTFVEEDVPDVSINPENYRLEISGPLHVVRYDRRHLFAIVRSFGFTVDDYSYATEADGQSAIYLSRVR
jgi:cyclopropane fatty-acyl-phospholipid synthase-like methyltransferase